MSGAADPKLLPLFRAVDKDGMLPNLVPSEGIPPICHSIES